jgi:hypothetical protein
MGREGLARHVLLDERHALLFGVRHYVFAAEPLEDEFHVLRVRSILLLDPLFCLVVVMPELLRPSGNDFLPFVLFKMFRQCQLLLFRQEIIHEEQSWNTWVLLQYVLHPGKKILKYYLVNQFTFFESTQKDSCIVSSNSDHELLFSFCCGCKRILV